MNQVLNKYIRKEDIFMNTYYYNFYENTIYAEHLLFISGMNVMHNNLIYSKGRPASREASICPTTDRRNTIIMYSLNMHQILLKLWTCFMDIQLDVPIDASLKSFSRGQSELRPSRPADVFAIVFKTYRALAMNNINDLRCFFVPNWHGIPLLILLLTFSRIDWPMNTSLMSSFSSPIPRH